MSKKTSEYGIKLIAQREGEVLHGYLDSKKLLTVGVGHLVKPGEPYKLNQPITKEESRRLLASDLAEAEDAVNSAVHVELSQNQFDALVSLTVNIGVNGFKRSRIVRALNADDFAKAAADILLWNKPPEIQGRRRTEWSQFLHPYKHSELQPTESNKAPQDTADVKLDPPSGNEVPTNQIADTIVNTGTDNKSDPVLAATSGEVVVKKEKVSLVTKIVSIGTSVYGAILLFKTNFESLYDKTIDALDPKLIAWAIVELGIIALGIWLYNRSANRADGRTQQLVEKAADQTKNTVTLAE